MSFTSSRILRTSLRAAMIGSAVYISARPVWADEGVRPGRSKSGDKLPVYSEVDGSPITLIETNHPLSPYVAQAREATTQMFNGARGYIESGVSSWISFERKVEREVKTILPKDEPLTPGIIYVLISGLTGSVLTRTRSFPIRFLTPPLFTLAAMPYFLPQTAANLRTYLSNLEDTHFPEFAASHDRFNDALELHWNMVWEKLRGASQEAKGWTNKAVEGVEKGTGVKVSDVVKRVGEKVQVEKQWIANAANAVGSGTPGTPTSNVGAAVVGKNEEQIVVPAGAKLEKVAIVVEQKPVAEIVQIVEEKKPEVKKDEGKRLV